MSLPLLIVVLGPTASGKSALGLALAQRLGGEIVNFDSVQVYRGFDIGSAKTPPQEREGVPHHLLDVLDPADRCSAGDFARLGRAALADITARGKVPVLVGGTGFYLRALLKGLFEGPARDESLRARLEGIANRGRLHRLLVRLDRRAAERIHPNDRPKLIRAAEVCLLERRPLTEAHAVKPQPLEGYRIVRLGLDPPRVHLYERINLRSRAMFEVGLLDEVADLLARGAPRSAWALGALGYRQALACLDGGISVEEAIEQTAQATRNYAKRQWTWFRRQEPETLWLQGFGEDPAVLEAALRTAESTRGFTGRSTKK
ncbi:MAG: tRNA (adenosine(37)-N6)-dimethylallyltransferase MiaA [Acidobacteria bacterium]|nr:tRNA (adenosine(37)-N6)-dimethylallyltransferase MiaA [Acidobacteriota bacterium]